MWSVLCESWGSLWMNPPESRDPFKDSSSHQKKYGQEALLWSSLTKKIRVLVASRLWESQQTSAEIDWPYQITEVVSDWVFVVKHLVSNVERRSMFLFCNRNVTMTSTSQWVFRNRFSKTNGSIVSNHSSISTERERIPSHGSMAGHRRNCLGTDGPHASRGLKLLYVNL
jgi:hypothetical protein